MESEKKKKKQGINIIADKIDFKTKTAIVIRKGIT